MVDNIISFTKLRANDESTSLHKQKKKKARNVVVLKRGSVSRIKER